MEPENQLRNHACENVDEHSLCVSQQSTVAACPQKTISRLRNIAMEMGSYLIPLNCTRTKTANKPKSANNRRVFNAPLGGCVADGSQSKESCHQRQNCSATVDVVCLVNLSSSAVCQRNGVLQFLCKSHLNKLPTTQCKCHRCGLWPTHHLLDLH